MPKWIDLRERQPKMGQLVVVLGKPYREDELSRAENRDIHLCEWDTSPDWLYSSRYQAEYWYPIPVVGPYEKPTEQPLPRKLQELVDDLTKLLKRRAPRLDWRVTVVSRYAPDLLDTIHIEAEAEVVSYELKAWHEIDLQLYMHHREDIIDQVIQQMVYGLAQEMVRP